MRKLLEELDKISEGQSILEVVFSIAVVMLIIIGVVSLASSSIKDSIFSRNQTQATKRAQEAMEWLRGERDGGWDDFYLRATSGTYCLNELSWDYLGRCSADTFIENTNLVRETTLRLVDESEIEAVVNVYWEDSQGSHEVESITDFTDWR